MIFLFKNDFQQVVYGIVLEPEVIDGQGDIISEEVIEKACHEYTSKSDRKMKINHKDFNNQLTVVESWIQKMDETIEGRVVKKGTWLMGVKVSDNSVWEKIINGELKGFSIGGKAIVSSINEKNPAS